LPRYRGDRSKPNNERQKRKEAAGDKDQGKAKGDQPGRDSQPRQLRKKAAQTPNHPCARLRPSGRFVV
jgi:hypothetical protein